MTTQALQLHAVIEKNAPLRDAGPPHQIISLEKFDAVISDYDLGEDTTETLANELAAAALKHHRILLVYCADLALLPMRFGSVFSSLDALIKAMTKQKVSCLGALEILSDHREYTIELVAEQLLKPSPVPSDTGRAFLNNRMKARDQRRTLSTDRSEFAQSVQARVSNQIGRTPIIGASNAEKLLVLTAHLSPTALRLLRVLALDIQAEAKPLGVSLQIRGPWPAYHFDTSQFEYWSESDDA